MKKEPQQWIFHRRPLKKAEPAPKRKQCLTPLRLAAIALTAALGFLFLKKFDVRFAPFEIRPRSNVLTIETRPSLPTEPSEANGGDDAAQTVRLAVWNLENLDFAKISDSKTGERLAALIAENDFIALLGLRSGNRFLPEALGRLLNRPNGGEIFSFLAQPPDTEGRQSAFFFKTNRVAADAETLAFFSDPTGRLAPNAMAAAFAARGPENEERFTWTAVCVRAETQDERQLDVLADLYEAVRDRAGRAGHAEDDILLFGSFSVSLDRLGAIRQIPNLAALFDSVPTTTGGEAADHLIFDRTATTEYVEQFGVVDPRARFKLTPEEARAFGEHFLVWAEFTIREN